MARRAIQRNNQSPMGFGQPGRGGNRGEQNMEAVLMRPEDQDMFGQGRPPNVYPDQPQWGPQVPSADFYQREQMRNQRIAAGPGQGFPSVGQGGPGGQLPQPRGGGFNWQQGQGPQGGEDYYQQAYGNAGPALNPQVEHMRRQLANPTVPGQGAQSYDQLQQAVQQSIQNGYTDISGMRDVFKPGQFTNQLSGYNVNGIMNGGERGTDTLKNMMGTIFSNYDVTKPGALRSALPDIQRALPGATIVEHANEDLLDPDGPNGPMQPVDVIQSATPGGAGAAWAWQPQGQGTGPQGPSMLAYQQGLLPQMAQTQSAGLAGPPEVADQNSAMQFLQWLLQQQQQGQLPQYDYQRGF